MTAAAPPTRGLHYPTWTDEQVTQRGEWLGSCDEVAVVESYSWFHLEAFEPVWQEVEPPALLLYGDESPVVTPDDARRLHEVNPAPASWRLRTQAT